MQKFKDSEITPEEVFFNRRKFMQGAGALAATSLMGAPALALTPNSYEDITTYNNFYEFGVDKGAPKSAAQQLTTSPWSIEISGLFNQTGQFAIEDVLSGIAQQKRVYRFRCVEAWSMVVPWNGVMLKDVLNKFGVQSGAKYISFETLLRKEEMPGTKFPSISWPYREGLRIDEAMHPLTLLATGIYDKPMPKQNGAPIRLVVPWKYGFKSIKSIIRITAQADQPYTTWNAINKREYGFYANVNPKVDHPRWSQASERVIGSGLLGGRQDTLMFNGYDEVAGLYSGMDLNKFY